MKYILILMFVLCSCVTPKTCLERAKETAVVLQEEMPARIVGGWYSPDPLSRPGESHAECQGFRDGHWHFYRLIDDEIIDKGEGIFGFDVKYVIKYPE